MSNKIIEAGTAAFPGPIISASPISDTLTDLTYEFDTLRYIIGSTGTGIAAAPEPRDVGDGVPGFGVVGADLRCRRQFARLTYA